MTTITYKNRLDRGAIASV